MKPIVCGTSTIVIMWLQLSVHYSSGATYIKKEDKPKTNLPWLAGSPGTFTLATFSHIVKAPLKYDKNLRAASMLA